MKKFFFTFKFHRFDVREFVIKRNVSINVIKQSTQMSRKDRVYLHYL